MGLRRKAQETTHREVLVRGKCDHANAQQAHAEAGLSSLLPSSDVVARLCAAATNRTASFHDVTLDYQLTKTYFDGGSVWNDGSEAGLAVDAARAVRFSNVAADSVRLDLPRGPQGDASKVIANFENCESGAGMCCFLHGGASNAEVCAVDLEASPRSNHVANGWSVYNANDGDETYCEGFTWDAEDETSFSSQHRGNVLFEISVRKNLLERGRTKNVPGSPMCGCVEQMPIITEAACTEAVEAYSFKYSSEGLPVISLAIQFQDCGALSQVEQLSDRVVGEGNCPAAVDRFLSTRTNGPYRQGTPYWYADETYWIPIIGKGSQYWYPMDKIDFQEEIANKGTDGVGTIIRRICTSCRRSHRDIYYKRLTPIPSNMDLMEILLNAWVQDNNVMGVDFELYSTMSYLNDGVNKWKFCNYNSKFGFPFECGPEVQTANMWNSFKSKRGYAKDVAFYLYK